MTKDEKTGEATLRSYKVPKSFDISQIINYLYE